MPTYRGGRRSAGRRGRGHLKTSRACVACLKSFETGYKGIHPKCGDCSKQHCSDDSNNTTTTVRCAIDICRHLPLLAFPGSTSTNDLDQQRIYMEQQELEFASSHRQWTLPGNRWECRTLGSTFFTQKYEDTGVLQCRSEVAEFSGILHNVPAGRWQVELLLFVKDAPLWKEMDWYIYVTKNGDDESESTVLQFQTGRTANAAIAACHWFRFFMATITTPASGGSVRLRIRQKTTIHDRQVSTINFGGFVLRPSSVDWKREAVLLRMLHPSTEDLNDEKRDASPLHQLPRDVAIHIAQYLITPMPQETLLLATAHPCIYKGED